eukprot:m.339558 g.339558  ORF g.339558 m.339558 type:complete len:1589 (+) comp19819_c0_seq1:49-4815(+)
MKHCLQISGKVTMTTPIEDEETVLALDKELFHGDAVGTTYTNLVTCRKHALEARNSQSDVSEQLFKELDVMFERCSRAYEKIVSTRLRLVVVGESGTGKTRWVNLQICPDGDGSGPLYSQLQHSHGTTIVQEVVMNPEADVLKVFVDMVEELEVAQRVLDSRTLLTSRTAEDLAAMYDEQGHVLRASIPVEEFYDSGDDTFAQLRDAHARDPDDEDLRDSLMRYVSRTLPSRMQLVQQCAARALRFEASWFDIPENLVLVDTPGATEFVETWGGGGGGAVSGGGFSDSQQSNNGSTGGVADFHPVLRHTLRHAQIIYTRLQQRTPSVDTIRLLDKIGALDNVRTPPILLFSHFRADDAARDVRPEELEDTIGKIIRAASREPTILSHRLHMDRETRHRVFDQLSRSVVTMQDLPGEDEELGPDEQQGLQERRVVRRLRTLAVRHHSRLFMWESSRYLYHLKCMLQQKPKAFVSEPRQPHIADNASTLPPASTTAVGGADRQAWFLGLTENALSESLGKTLEQLGKEVHHELCGDLLEWAFAHLSPLAGDGVALTADTVLDKLLDDPVVDQACALVVSACHHVFRTAIMQLGHQCTTQFRQHVLEATGIDVTAPGTSKGAQSPAEENAVFVKGMFDSLIQSIAALRQQFLESSLSVVDVVAATHTADPTATLHRYATETIRRCLVEAVNVWQQDDDNDDGDDPVMVLSLALSTKVAGACMQTGEQRSVMDLLKDWSSQELLSKTLACAKSTIKLLFLNASLFQRTRNTQRLLTVVTDSIRFMRRFFEEIRTRVWPGPLTLQDPAPEMLLAPVSASVEAKLMADPPVGNKVRTLELVVQPYQKTQKVEAHDHDHDQDHSEAGDHTADDTDQATFVADHTLRITGATWEPLGGDDQQESGAKQPAGRAVLGLSVPAAFDVALKQWQNHDTHARIPPIWMYSVYSEDHLACLEPQGSFSNYLFRQPPPVPLEGRPHLTLVVVEPRQEEAHANVLLRSAVADHELFLVVLPRNNMDPAWALDAIKVISEGLNFEFYFRVSPRLIKPFEMSEQIIMLRQCTWARLFVQLQNTLRSEIVSQRKVRLDALQAQLLSAETQALMLQANPAKAFEIVSRNAEISGIQSKLLTRGNQSPENHSRLRTRLQQLIAELHAFLPEDQRKRFAGISPPPISFVSIGGSRYVYHQWMTIVDPSFKINIVRPNYTLTEGRMAHTLVLNASQTQQGYYCLSQDEFCSTDVAMTPPAPSTPGGQRASDHNQTPLMGFQLAEHRLCSLLVKHGRVHVTTPQFAYQASSKGCGSRGGRSGAETSANGSNVSDVSAVRKRKRTKGTLRMAAASAAAGGQSSHPSSSSAAERSSLATLGAASTDGVSRGGRGGRGGFAALARLIPCRPQRVFAASIAEANEQLRYSSRGVIEASHDQVLRVLERSDPLRRDHTAIRRLICEHVVEHWAALGIPRLGSAAQAKAWAQAFESPSTDPGFDAFHFYGRAVRRRVVIYWFASRHEFSWVACGDLSAPESLDIEIVYLPSQQPCFLGVGHFSADVVMSSAAATDDEEEGGGGGGGVDVVMGVVEQGQSQQQQPQQRRKRFRETKHT